VRGLIGIVVGAVVAVLVSAAPAGAKNKLFWSNFGDSGHIYSANLNGGGAQEFLPAGPAAIDSPAGMAVDMKRSRLYWTDWNTDAIYWAKLSGNASGTFATGGLPVDEPTGLQIDRERNRVYWSNFDAATLIWTRLNGGGGGTIATGAATTALVSGIAIDPKANRIYWVNFDTPGSVGAANLDGTGNGSDLNLTGASALSRAAGVALNGNGQRIYIGNNIGPSVSFAATDGGPGAGDLNLAGATLPSPHGVAIDPDRNRLYWVNSGGNVPIAYAALNGSGGSDLDTGAITASDAAFPLVLKKPRIKRKPKVKPNKSGKKLRCKPKRIAPDQPGSHLYRAARKVNYKWERNGKRVKGEKKKSLKTGGESGRYRCTVIAKNFFGKSKRRSKKRKV
jgi:DNA-binding beta-propeller fold protein YncE